MANATKAELQELVNQAGEAVDGMLDPRLTREELVARVQDLDELLNGSDEDEDDEDEDQDEDDDNEGEGDNGIYNAF